MLISQFVDIPKNYECPITREMMINSVVAADGFTYEYEANLEWLKRGYKNSPMTGEELNH